MWIEYSGYVVTFVVSAGLSAVGIMLSYQLYQSYGKTPLQMLLYQQIFLISFFLFAIWGNIILHEIIADLNLNPAVRTRLLVLIPLLGLPFLLISWFMLLRFAYGILAIPISRRFTWFYFSAAVLFAVAMAVFFQLEIFEISAMPDLWVARSLTAANLAVHGIFLLPFLKNSNVPPGQPGFTLPKSNVYLYLGATMLYSFAWFFFPVFGFLSTCLAILLLFAGNILLPVFIKLNSTAPAQSPSAETKMNFAGFCRQYDISRREAEIILEICSGKTNKAIAETLFISLQTVKDHNSRIYSKTQVKTRLQLSNLVREKTGAPKSVKPR